MRFVEPFAGELDLPKFIEDIFGKLDWGYFDIEPKFDNITKNDSISNFPQGWDFCITNPPYLAKNSAKRRKLSYPDTIYDDVYKVCLELSLENCDYVVAIIPESFITSGILRERLDRVISLDFNPFEDTEHPVCIALFSPTESNDFEIYRGETFLGSYNELKKFKPKACHCDVKFNRVDGQIGLLGVDNTQGDSIRFCSREEILDSEIKHTSRARTRILLGDKEMGLIYRKHQNIDNFIKALNKSIKVMREETKDVFMTSFKGLRADGKYRRRLDFKSAKGIVCSLLEENR